MANMIVIMIKYDNDSCFQNKLYILGYTTLQRVLPPFVLPTGTEELSQSNTVRLIFFSPLLNVNLFASFRFTPQRTPTIIFHSQVKHFTIIRFHLFYSTSPPAQCVFQQISPTHSLSFANFTLRYLPRPLSMGDFVLWELLTSFHSCTVEV